MDRDLIPIGKIVKTHGIKGAVKVHMLSDFPERFASVKSIYAVKDGKKQRLSVSHSQPYMKGALLTFTNINNGEEAKKLEGSLLCIREDEMLSPPDDSYYIHDLIGFDVFDEENARLGELREIWQLPANDVFVVQGSDDEMLFPAIKDAIKSISRKEKRIIVTRALGVV